VWEIEVTDEFLEWWQRLEVDQQELLHVVVARRVDAVHHCAAQLRASKAGALRVLFMFDPRRSVILLLGGDKAGQWDAWYEWAIPAADDLYDIYLAELRNEGVI